MSKILMTALAFCCPLAYATTTLDIKADLPFTPRGKTLEGLVVTIDAAGGGNWQMGGCAEADMNMLAAGELRHHLSESGATVFLTRQDDRPMASPETASPAEETRARTRLAEEKFSHIFVSIQHTFAGDRPPGAPMVLCRPPDDAQVNDKGLERALAEAMRDEIQKTMPRKEQVEARDGNTPLLTGTRIPAVAVDFGRPLASQAADAATGQGAHRAEALAVYNGITRVWRERGAELAALRAQLFPASTAADASAAREKQKDKALTEKHPGIPLALVKAALQAWPFEFAPRSSAEAEWVIENYKKRVLTDPTFFLLRVSAEKTSDTWILRGYTNYKKLSNIAEDVLKTAGCRPIRNEIGLLPSTRLGGKRFGIVQIPMALIWGRPGEGDDSQTQLLLGERVFLLDQTPDGGYLLLNGGDGYIGWVRSDAVLRMDEHEFRPWEIADNAIVKKDCFTDGFRIPAGAALPVVAAKSSGITVRLPRPVKGKDTVTLPLDRAQMNPHGARGAGMNAARAAAEFLTVPYVFGARSRLGLDCSGLTNIAYAAAGLTLPRDAKQQVIVGRMIATPWHRPPLLPGDLIYFCDDTGRVYHAAVSLGGQRWIHSCPPEAQVSSFDPADPLYSKEWTKQFAFARRPLQ